MEKNTNLPYLTEEEKEAIFQFKAKLIKNLGDNFLFIEIFGSRATGQADKYSDIDIIVVVRELNRQTDEIVSNLSFDLHLMCETPVDIWVSSLEELEQLTKEQWPFYLNIEKEGLRI
jgi:predicted nucleotidyltransferase